MTLSEYATVALITVPVFGGLQAVLRWFAAPGVGIEVHGDKMPKALRLDDYAVHHLEVWNYEWPWWLRPLVLRVAPEGCVVKLQYWLERDNDDRLKIVFKENGQEESWLLGRWNINPEPISQGITIRGPDGTVVTTGGLATSALIVNRRLAKLFPSEKRGQPDAQPFTVAFAIKKKGEERFYHFNDESYRYSSNADHWLCNPNWGLGLGVYRINVRVSGYGLLAAKTATFRLHNLGTDHNQFILEPLTKSPNTRRTRAN